MADYEAFGKDVKAGLSKDQLKKKYSLTQSAYKQYLYMARTLGILQKGELPGKPSGEEKPGRRKQPLKPSEPLRPSQPKEPKKTKIPKRPKEPFQPSKPFEPSQPSEPKGKDRLKVHWELPRELVARIRYKATVEGKAVIDLVRDTLNKHF